MRPERNPLDLNILPAEDNYTRGDPTAATAKHLSEDSSSSVGYRKKKSGGGGGGKEGKDECGKVYECRFCSLKFCKSQALGGHMNRHRQERETETLNRARQLVFSNDNLAASHLGGQPITHGAFHQTPDPTLPFRSMYQPRLFPPGSSSTILQQQQQQQQQQPPPPPPPPQQQQQQQPPPSYLYASPSRLVTYPSQYHPGNEYYVGHVLSSSSNNPNYMSGGGPESNYTCIGAPVGHGFVAPGNGGGGTTRGGGGGGRDGSLQNQEEGLNWDRNYTTAAGTQRRLDHSSSINRFQDGF